MSNTTAQPLFHSFYCGRSQVEAEESAIALVTLEKSEDAAKINPNAARVRICDAIAVSIKDPTYHKLPSSNFCFSFISF